jgi:hypothetical protein
MKLSNQLVTSTSQKLDKAVNNSNETTTETSKLVLSWLKDKSASQVFLNWLTAKSKIVEGETQAEKLERGQSVKNFQNVINATPFQRMYFGIPQGKALTEQLRVKKAQQPMVDKKLATQEQVDSKKYFAWTTPIEKEQATLKSDMAKLKKKYGATNKEMSAVANTLD